MRAVRRRAIGCAAVAATGAVLLATAGAQADVGPNQATFRDRVGNGIKTGQMGVQLFNYGGFINNAGGQTSLGQATEYPSPIIIGRPECDSGGAQATTTDCRTYRLGLLFDFLRQKGVTNVELFGHSGFPASNDIAGLTAYRAMLDAYGLHAGGWHGDMSEANWDTRVTAAKILGADYIGSGGFPAPGIGSYANTLATAEALNRLGKRSIEAGLGPVYFHNHQEEFQNQYVDEGVLKPAIDIIMERTDARYVVAEIDVKWSSDALNDVTGEQTAAFINKPSYQARVQLLHIKDGIDITGPSAPHRATGSGEIDFKPIFLAANNRVRYYHQEHDGGSLGDANVSLSNLKGIGTAVTGTLLALPPTFNSVAANTPAASNVTPVTVSNTGDLPLTITNVQIGGVPGGPNDSADFQIVSQTCSGAGSSPLAAGGGIPAARGRCVVNVGFRPTKTNYTSVARLNFTSGADTATENVLLVGKSNGDPVLVNVGGNVASVMQLSVPNTSGNFGTFVPGIGTNYNTALAATVTTTTGDAALSVTDSSSTAPGHLVNGAFSLASALNIRAVAGGDQPPAFAPLNETAGTPLLLRSWNGPTTSALTLDLRQAIGAGEALRAGTYSKSLTFTLSTTTP